MKNEAYNDVRVVTNKVLTIKLLFFHVKRVLFCQSKALFLYRTYLQPPSSAAIFQFYEMDKLVQNFNPSISRDSFNFNLHTPIGQNLLYDGAFINAVCTFLCHLFVNLISWLEYKSAVIFYFFLFSCWIRIQNEYISLLSPNIQLFSLDTNFIQIS